MTPASPAVAAMGDGEIGLHALTAQAYAAVPPGQSPSMRCSVTGTVPVGPKSTESKCPSKVTGPPAVKATCARIAPLGGEQLPVPRNRWAWCSRCRQEAHRDSGIGSHAPWFLDTARLSSAQRCQIYRPAVVNFDPSIIRFSSFTIRSMAISSAVSASPSRALFPTPKLVLKRTGRA